jgi:hypothetical protein
MPGFTPILEDFLGNPLEFENGLGQGYDDLTLDDPTTGPAPNNPSDSDSFTLTDQDKRPKRAHPQAVDVSISSADAFSSTANTPSIGVAASDAATEAESATANAQGPTSADVQFLTATDLVSALTATISSSDSFECDESPEEVVVSTNLALNDSDTGTLTEAGSNASGGVSSSFEGVVIAFGNNSFDTAPTWTRLDDPAGVS